jgi:hypothetical protein
MPKLLLFAPCDRVIIDEASKTLSLITILEQVESPAPPSTNVAVALTWFAVALWQRLPEDEGKTYEQRTYLVQPDGSKTLEGSASFRLTERTHRVLSRTHGFPISQAGDYLLTLALREKDAGEEWVTMAEFPIRVIHTATDNE